MEAPHKKTDTIPMLLRLNAEHSEQFVNSQISRRIHRKKYSTEIAVMKCMDGRVHLPVMTNTPLGIMQPWRNIGGKFNLGWAHYRDTITEWVDYSSNAGKESVVFTTYHFARGLAGEDSEKARLRGCAGFGYDTEAAKKASWELKEQYDRVFRNDSLFVVNCGIETDFEALIFHGENGETLDLSEANFAHDNDIVMALHSLYPNISATVLKDLVPIVRGNIQHSAEIRVSNRPAVDTEHKERVLAVGRGFDWLHEPNLALIVGPYDPDLGEVIATAAGILKNNVSAGRVDAEDDLVLLVSATYNKDGFRRRLAEEKAKELTERSMKAIQKQYPDLKFNVVTATCDMETRKLNIL